MKYLKLAVCYLLFSGFLLPLTAQVNVYIEDETGQGFYLGLNHYLQHPEKQTHLLLTGLDTVPYSLQLEQDTFNFQRKLHLRKTGNHFYVLKLNYRGQLKLRYRGDGKPAGEYAEVEYHRDVPWPEEWKPKGPVEKTDYWELAYARQKAAKQAALAHRAEPDADSLKIVVTAESDSSGVLAAGNDTVVKNTVVIEESEPQPDSFEQFVKRLQNTQFEFDRVKMAKELSGKQRLSIAEIRTILKTLKYDHSKLDFLTNARTFALNPHDLDQLKNELEYVISQKKFEKLIEE